MMTNPYAPPVAEVRDVIAVETLASDPPFFAVSVLKLFVMCVCTFGIYQFYWFYKNWQRIAERDRETVWPLIRHSLPFLVVIRAWSISVTTKWEVSSWSRSCTCCP